MKRTVSVNGDTNLEMIIASLVPSAALFPNVPIAAFTATATQKVKSDIINQLYLDDPALVKATAFRSNITISVKNREGNGQKQLLSIIEQKKGESGIVYAFSRKETEEIARFLRSKGVVTVFTMPE